MHTNALPVSIDSLLHGNVVEWERLEFKKGWNPEDVVHTVCAFANDFHNLGGGYIVVGVEEINGRPQLPPVGLQANQIDAIQKEILQLGQSAIQPAYHPRSVPVQFEAKTILVIWAPAGETRPYRAKHSLSNASNDWREYIRKQSSTVVAKGHDLQELIGLTATVPFDDRYNQQASLHDLSIRLIEEFLREVGSDLVDRLPGLSIEQLGRQMNIVGGPVEAPFPKNIGLMMFNEHPEQFFPVMQIDVVYFPDGPGGDKFEEKIFKGPIQRMIRDALGHIQRSYLKQTIIKHPDRAEADRIWNFPFAAIEEALVNAIYHRSYEIREPVEVRITPEELTVVSYPGPDRSIRMDDLAEGKAISRRYRNRRIGDFLKELQLTEGRSTGIQKIRRAIAQNGSPPPVFETDDDRSYFIARIPAHIETVVSVQGVEARGLVGQVGTKSGPSRDQVSILANCLISKSITELMTEIGRTNRTKFRDQVLTPLLDSGWLEMTIPEKPTSSKQQYRTTELGRQILEQNT